MKKTIEQIICRFGGRKRDWSTTPETGWVHRDAKVDPGVIIGPKVVIRSGAFHGGTFHGGVFNGGTFHSGTFHGGMFHCGMFLGGTFHGGDFLDGMFCGGTFHGGAFHYGDFYGGTFYGGTFHYGTFRGGVFHRGKFLGGEIVGGDWYSAPMFVAGSVHTVTNAKPGHIKIGCKCEPFDWWLSKEALAFAKYHRYTPKQIKEYRAIVRLIIQFGK